MANRRTAVGKLTRRMPWAAKGRVIKAILSAEGNAHAAARVLGISRRQFSRYVLRFNLEEKLEEVRKHFLWHRPKAERKGRKRVDLLARRKRLSTRVENPPQSRT